MNELELRAKHAVNPNRTTHFMEWNGKTACGIDSKKRNVVASPLIKNPTCKRCQKKLIDGCGLP